MQGFSSGVPHRLDPRVIAFDRSVGWIVTATASAMILMVVFVTWLTSSIPGWATTASGIGWIGVTAALAWFGHVWPERDYAHTSYAVDDLGIEIRTGVYWRAIIAVPRSRVQHIDVSQGPLQRSYGLATLVIFTAGTEHSRVRLQGLAHETALGLRDSLLPKKADDGV